MAGMDIVIVKSDENGNIDVEDLKAKAEANKDNLKHYDNLSFYTWCL